MYAPTKSIGRVALSLAVLIVVGCGGKGSTNTPALTDHQKDSLAVRNILDANGLNSTGVFGAVAIPDDITGTRVGELDLQNKNISVISDGIGQLTALTTLRLDSNAIASLPPAIGNCVSLKLLSLAKNMLTGLPVEIGKLHALTNLNVSQNSLAALPSSIGGLSNLHTLRLDNNQLAQLPDSIILCPMSGYLLVANNKLCAPDSTILQWLNTYAELDWPASQRCN